MPKNYTQEPTKTSYYLKKALDDLGYYEEAYSELGAFYEKQINKIIQDAIKEKFHKDHLVNNLRLENRELRIKLYGEHPAIDK